ncbi:MAG TPA: hypothetical protein VFU15_01270 [Bacteroidia bacterium]|nr:hypothetical protein [Bacteroidia bacterium]
MQKISARFGILSAAFFLFILPASAQLKVKDVDTAYYNKVIATGKKLSMKQDALLGAKAAALPQNFTDTLKKYDWYELDNYSFADKEYRGRFTEEDASNSRQYDFFRYDADGTINTMYLFHTIKQGEYSFYTTTFDKNTAEKLVGVENIRGAAYMVSSAYGEKEWQKIISYKDQVMIKELTRYGKPGETPVKFRIAYMAMTRDDK